MKKKIIKIGYGNVKKVLIGDKNPLVFIGGPCAIENKDHAFYMASNIRKICKSLNIPWIYKSCYDKDCRSSLSSFHGVGIDEGLKILEGIRNEFGIPVVSDFSDPSHANLTGKICDLIQIPAYLCRQTSILKAAALTKNQYI
jgi:2-dehydro-3-deoxyphosphooctonate aldolase (KDO 8-P synthase)